MTTPTTTAGVRSSRFRPIKVLIVALLAVTAILVPAQQRAEAAEVCTGPECDTIAFVSNEAVFTLYQDLIPSSLVGRFYYGNPGDEPLMGDWDCDGEQTPGMYRRSTGLVYLRNTNTQGIADETYIFGNPSDVPIVGDFNGDGCDTVSIYRPSEARFYLSYALGAPIADVSFFFGGFGDTPVVGDWDGDGVDTVGIYREGNGLVALTDGHRGGGVDHQYYFGGSGDRILAGDWDGDGVDTVGIYRYSSGMIHLTNGHRTGVADYSMQVGRYRRAVVASGVTTVPAGVVAVPGFATPPPRTASGPIDISGESNVVIENVHVSNPDGVCIAVTQSSNVTIRNSTIGPCGDDAIYLSDVDNATVSGNYINETQNGVLVHRSYSIRVDGNALINAGRNLVQFDKVDGPGSSISGNRGQNELGGSDAEDMISLFSSNGTAGSPIRVVGNHLRNGGPSDSGSGILLGDGGGSHQIAEGNVLVNPGQVGLGVAGGYDMTLHGNLIYSDAVSWSNVGMYVWDQADGCGDVTVSGNRVNWTAAGGYSNGFFNGGGCGPDMYGNDWNAPIGPGIF